MSEVADESRRSAFEARNDSNSLADGLWRKERRRFINRRESTQQRRSPRRLTAIVSGNADDRRQVEGDGGFDAIALLADVPGAVDKVQSTDSIVIGWSRMSQHTDN